MNSELCTRCGSCVAASGGTVAFREREGKYLPGFRDEPDEALVNRILDICPAIDYSFPDFNRDLFPEPSNFHSYIGSYESLFIGYSKDEEIRRNSASGGILSAILVFLIETKKVDGVITTRMSAEKPWITETFVARTREEIMEGAQSKYIITSVNEILSETMNLEEKLAFVGLPSQVQSIRKMQKKGDPLVKNIEYIFGPFYGNTLYFSSVISFLRSYGEKDYTKIKKLWFRFGEWPGNMRVELESGRILELKKFHANYLIPFHILKNSLYCTDFTNEFTDISGGDAWAPDYEERGKGFSMVVVRSVKGKEIIDEMFKAGILSLSVLTEGEAIKMHSHGYDFKKRGAFIRMKFRKLRGGKIPEWGYQAGKLSISRYLMEGVISFLFFILGTSLSRFIVERFSPSFIGKMFEKTRKVWKSKTSSIKREDLI